jgi:hypothetical protein
MRQGYIAEQLTGWRQTPMEGLAGTKTAQIVLTRAAEALPDIIRHVIESQTSLALDSKADREALIRDLIEALC